METKKEYIKRAYIHQSFYTKLILDYRIVLFTLPLTCSDNLIMRINNYSYIE